jgi:hypothetical protein
MPVVSRPVPRSRLPLPALSLLASIALVPACGGDDGPDLPDPAVVDEAVLRAELEAWRGRLRKDCSLVDAMPSAFAADQRTGVDLELDAAHVTRLLGPGLWVGDADRELFVLDAPHPPSRSGFGDRRISASVDGDVTQDIVLGSELSWDGTCVITYGGEEVYRGQLWGQLPVAVHARASGEPAREDGRRQLYTPGGSLGTAYVVDDSLRVLVTGLAADLPAARAAFATALGVEAAVLDGVVVAGPGWLDHVVLERSVAPSPIIDAGFGNAPLDVVADPTFAVARADLAAVTAGGAKTAIVRLPRPVAGGVGSTSLTVRYTSDVLDGNLVRSTITGVDRPVFLPPSTALPAPGATCVSSIAAAASSYLADPARSNGTRLVPVPVMLGIGAVEARWLLAPCERFSTDLAAELRTDEAALRQLAALLDPALYGTRALVPNRWSALLARIVVGEAAVATLDRVVVGSATSAAVDAQRALLADPAYRAADAGERAERRALFWHTSILCGEPMSAALHAALLAVDADDIEAVMLGMTGCPAS